MKTKKGGGKKKSQPRHKILNKVLYIEAIGCHLFNKNFAVQKISHSINKKKNNKNSLKSTKQQTQKKKKKKKNKKI
jgi:hypothetical protein